MAYDAVDVERIRTLLSGEPVEVVEKRVIGGALGFMVNGHLCCAVGSHGLTVRVGTDGAAEALREPHVGPLEAGGRTAKGFVVVARDGYRIEDDLRRWIAVGLDAVARL